MFALGVLSWMYSRSTEVTEEFLRKKFAKKPDIAEANIAALRSGWNYGETAESFAVQYEIPRRPSRPAPTGTSPATPPWPGASSPPESRRTCRCSWAPTRSPRPATSSTN
ncbi:hypothetical protein GCM10029992_21070 [Glycomyces albus]